MHIGREDGFESIRGNVSPIGAPFAGGETEINLDVLVRRHGLGPIVPRVEIPILRVVADGAVVVVCPIRVSCANLGWSISFRNSQNCT